jgi:DNA-binding MarR family transcriptional regulator
MPKVDPAKIWSLNYRLLTAVITQVSAEIASLGLEAKELFLLAELEDHPYPAELSACLSMPKPTVSVYVKRLEAAGFVRREIDAEDLRRHKLLLTPAGRKVMTQGIARLSEAFGERLARLSAREQLELKELLEKLS